MERLQLAIWQLASRVLELQGFYMVQMLPTGWYMHTSPSLTVCPMPLALPPPVCMPCPLPFPFNLGAMPLALPLQEKYLNLPETREALGVGDRV